METLTKSPTLTSTWPPSLRNSSIAIVLSDFSPAFTTTKLASMLTTSAVITSPIRISLRVRLSSKRAANDSPGGVLDFEDCAGVTLDIRKKTFSNRRLRDGGVSLVPGTAPKCDRRLPLSKVTKNQSLVSQLPEPEETRRASYRARPAPPD